MHVHVAALACELLLRQQPRCCTAHRRNQQTHLPLATPQTKADLRTSFEHTYTTSFLRSAAMDVLDGATRLDPDMNEEAQRWIETAKGALSFHTTTERSASASSARCGSPPPSCMSDESTQQQEDRNAFEDSFAAALAQPPMAYDGHCDHNDDYDDQTPLLNSYYKTSHSPQQAALQTPRHGPMEPPSKSKPSRSICLWNEVSHNSQYTRPAADILREVLEVSYPVASARACYEPLHEDQEFQGFSDGNGSRAKRRWWRRLLRVRVRG